MTEQRLRTKAQLIVQVLIGIFVVSGLIDINGISRLLSHERAVVPTWLYLLQGAAGLLWLAASVGLILTKEWGRKCGIAAIILSSVHILVLGCDTTQQILKVPPFEQGPSPMVMLWPVLLPAAIRLVTNIGSLFCLTRPSVKALSQKRM